MLSFIRKIFLFPVRLYRKFISPLKPPSCRYTPTCSQYMIDAVEEWGIIRGLALGIWRILRCNPFGRGGYDPVPKRKKCSHAEHDGSKKER